MRHIYLDVKAFGPVGAGDPFAFAAARFDASGCHRDAAAQRAWSVAMGPTTRIDVETLGWLASQAPQVLAQLSDPIPFATAWYDFLAWAVPELGGPHAPPPIVFWADDWADFAWLSIAARSSGVPELRAFGVQADATALLLASGVTAPTPAAEHTPHVAADDVRQGVAHLLRAVTALGVSLDRMILAPSRGETTT